jgi:hypothetical protein
LRPIYVHVIAKPFITEAIRLQDIVTGNPILLRFPLHCLKGIFPLLFHFPLHVAGEG